MYRESLRPTGPPDNDVKVYVEAMLGKATNVLNDDKLRQFMDYSRKVLRFFCVWDDRQRLYGDRRPYVLHYFLEDDTVEILEVCETNSGRDPFPQFLKRGPLPKGMPAVPDVTTKPKKDECYSPIDFRIGSYISVYGRPFFIHDCDEFTRFFYTESMGMDVDGLEPINVQEHVSKTERAPLPGLTQLAPWNLGALDDDEKELFKLMPKPPKKNFARLMNKSKTILRFKCRLVESAKTSLSNADKDRRFVLSYFVADDTISVFEPPVRNSGIIGGKFLERQKVYQPKSRVAYGESDLFVGNTLDIFNRDFELLDADEFTFQYMENNKHIYIRSDPTVSCQVLSDAIAGKEEDLKSVFIDLDKDGSGKVTPDVAFEAVKTSEAKGVSKQTLVTILRALEAEGGANPTFDSFLAFVSKVAGTSPPEDPEVLARMAAAGVA